MNNLKTFDQFNEGLLSSLSDTFSKLGKGLKKSLFSSQPRTEYSKELKQYGLSLDAAEDGQSMDIYHNKRLVGKITLSKKIFQYGT